MKGIEFLYLGLLGIGLVLSFFAWRQWNRTLNLKRDGIKATAKVVDLIPVSGEDGTTYKPVFEYRDLAKVKQRFESSISSSPPAHKVGEFVTILYSPNGKELKVVSFWGLYRWVVVLLCVASPMLIIGGGYFLYAWW